ncbi:hypothetical protein COX08_00820, partial [Candidatus Beckwithbacteria bacterium CG23_combo_of_CG06-09_8_20_14_all_34_8]
MKEFNIRGQIEVKLKLNIFLIIVLFAFLLTISIASAQTQTYILAPKNSSGGLYPDSTFYYQFNFTSDLACATVLLNHTETITMDNSGQNNVTIDLSSLNSAPSYICEYRNGTLKSVSPFNTNILGNAYIKNNITFVQKINFALGNIVDEVNAWWLRLNRNLDVKKINATNITLSDSVISNGTAQFTLEQLNASSSTVYYSDEVYLNKNASNSFNLNETKLNTSIWNLITNGSYSLFSDINTWITGNLTTAKTYTDTNVLGNL